MSREELIAGLRANWYLALALLLSPLAAVLAQSKWNVPNAESAVVDAAQHSAAALPSEPTLEPGPFPAPPSDRDKALQTIAEYQAALEKGLPDEEVPVQLRRIANLYYNPVQNYQQAVNHYERLIERYPNWKAPGRFIPTSPNATAASAILTRSVTSTRGCLNTFPLTPSNTSMPNLS